MSEELREMIARAAEHWAAQGRNWADGEDLLVWLTAASGHQLAMITPEKGWCKSSFSEWGQAQKMRRGLTALKKAIDGRASHQWIAAWRKQ